jgi:hypothetical protein
MKTLRSYDEKRAIIHEGGFRRDNNSSDNNLYFNGLYRILKIKEVIKVTLRDEKMTPHRGDEVQICETIIAQIMRIYNGSLEICDREINLYSSKIIESFEPIKKTSFDWQCSVPDFVPIINRMCPGKPMMGRNLDKKQNETFRRTSTTERYIINTMDGYSFEAYQRFDS